jgi:2-oxo-4-hydroxy-4-carboxy-5-ureidoimidazoline decarboxylase
MNEVLARWNESAFDGAVAEILPCCGSMAWARAMAMRRPMQDDATLMAASDDIWRTLPASDWMEAFRSHPRISESKLSSSSSSTSTAWATQEQKKVAAADDSVKSALAEGNRNYEEKFGHIFIVCATGKSASEMLEILNLRMRNDSKNELREAAEQQRQITQIRLKKWLQV